MSDKSFNRIMSIAFRDIHKCLMKEHNIRITGKGGDNEFVVLKSSVDTPETHKLNEELKIRGLNMTGNTNGFKSVN